MIQLLFAHKMKLLLKTLHTFASCAWVGGVSTVLIILNNDRSTISGDELFAFNSAITIIDDTLIGPGAGISLVSGALLCLTSRWGFFKHCWVVVKWVGTLVAIYVGVAYLNPWMRELARISDILRDNAARNIDYQQMFHKGTVAVCLQIAALFLLVFVSIFKPDLELVPSEPGLRRAMNPKKALRLLARVANGVRRSPGAGHLP